ncbi:MAG TPA: alpha/beta hydrolase, partial [Pyrinomonadaceae bacterium]
GFAVLAYDYRGYGTSAGAPSEEKSYEDIDAAYRYLTEELRVLPGKIILHGRSLGGGPSTDLAARRPVGGLILESTFTTAFRTVTRYQLVPFDKFRNLDKLALSKCPVLVIHGKDDRTIGFHHGEALFDSAPGMKYSLWVDNAGHNDLADVAGESYLNAIRDFSQELNR